MQVDASHVCQILARVAWKGSHVLSSFCFVCSPSFAPCFSFFCFSFCSLFGHVVPFEKKFAVSGGGGFLSLQKEKGPPRTEVLRTIAFSGSLGRGSVRSTSQTPAGAVVGINLNRTSTGQSDP